MTEFDAIWNDCTECTNDGLDKLCVVVRNFSLMSDFMPRDHGANYKKNLKIILRCDNNLR